jgi:hypothetical protein
MILNSTVESFLSRQHYLVLCAGNQWVLRRILGKQVGQADLYEVLVHLLIHFQPFCPAGIKIYISYFGFTNNFFGMPTAVRSLKRMLYVGIIENREGNIAYIG